MIFPIFLILIMMKINTLLTNLIILTAKCAMLVPTKIQDLEGIVKFYSNQFQKVEEIAQKETNIFLAFGDRQLLNRGDLRLLTEMQKAVDKLAAEGYDIKLGYFDSDIKKADKDAYALHAHSLPKIIFFKDNGKEFQVYKGGKSARLVQAWVKRKLRKVGLSEFYIRKKYQLDKKMMMLYYGDEGTDLFNFFKQEFWLKKRDFPVYRLMNFSVLGDMNCGATNKTEKNFVFVLSKNATLGPCALFYFDEMEKVRDVISQMTVMENEKNRQVGSFADNLKRVFKAKDKFFIFYDKSMETPEYEVYKQFCKKTAVECFFELNSDNRTTNFKKYFLGMETSVEDPEDNYIYYIDTREVYPSFKYRTKDFYDVDSLLDFKAKVERGEWERFFVSEKEIPDQRTKNKDVWITTADSYKKDIQDFRGDVVLILVNSQNRDNDMVYLARYYELARLTKQEFKNVPIQFMAIDVTRNDMPEFGNQGTPLFFLFDYMDKKPKKIILHKDPENSLSVLKDYAPSFSDPDLEDL